MWAIPPWLGVSSHSSCCHIYLLIAAVSYIILSRVAFNSESFKITLPQDNTGPLLLHSDALDMAKFEKSSCSCGFGCCVELFEQWNTYIAYHILSLPFFPLPDVVWQCVRPQHSAGVETIRFDRKGVVVRMEGWRGGRKRSREGWGRGGGGGGGVLRPEACIWWTAQKDLSSEEKPSKQIDR